MPGAERKDKKDDVSEQSSETSRQSEFYAGVFQQTPPVTPINIPFTVPPITSQMINPNFFNPFVHQPNIMMNQIDNQGIFITQQADTPDQFFFIPGNLFSHLDGNMIALNTLEEINRPQSSHNDDDKSSSEQPNNNKPPQVVFVPKLNANERNTDAIENYETYIMPVHIKKEENGKLELLPENENPDSSFQPATPEQWNMMQKICFMRNRHLEQIVEQKQEESSDTAVEKVVTESLVSKEESVAEFNNVEQQPLPITPLTLGSKGFVMVSYSKTNRNQRGASEELPRLSIKLSATDGNRNRKGLLLNMKKKKKLTKSLKLTDHISNTGNFTSSTSRFRRLRMDDKTQMWVNGNISCRDTKVRQLPNYVLDLCEVNSVPIPDAVSSIIDNGNSSEVLEGEPLCEHSQNCRIKPKAKIGFWRYMCSMNNCEFFKKNVDVECQNN